MDSNECKTVIPAARSTCGRNIEEILNSIDAAGAEFGKNVNEKYGSKGEW